MMLRPRHPRRQMGEDQVVPAVISDEPIGRGEIDADRPFLVADLALERRNLDRVERPGIADSSVHAVDAVHYAGPCWSGCAAANGSSALALASARTSVG